jgi:hypothetical protein
VQPTLLDPPTDPAARWRTLRRRAGKAARRPRGQLAGLLVALITLCAVAGLASANDVWDRREALARVAERGGPTTASALEIYQSLSDADATAANAFLASSVEPPDPRYRTNITKAAAALSTAASGATTSESAAAIAELSAYLPVYTGLIETARVYNRQGLPQGVPYLRTASWLMQDKLLPRARDLYQLETNRLAADQAEAARPGWLPLALGALALAGLVAAQIYLSRTTRRTFNVGLLAATVAALVAVPWYGLASADAAGHSAASQREGTLQMEAFAEARFEALQARRDEALTLVASGGGSSYEEDFVKIETRMGGLLAKATSVTTDQETATAVRQAADAWQRWLDNHKKLRQRDDAGDFEQAVLLASTMDHPDGTATPSTAVYDQLDQAIQRAKGRFGDETAQARSALSWYGAEAGTGVVVLMALAVAGTAAGLGYHIRRFSR